MMDRNRFISITGGFGMKLIRHPRYELIFKVKFAYMYSVVVSTHPSMRELFESAYMYYHCGNSGKIIYLPIYEISKYALNFI